MGGERIAISTFQRALVRAALLHFRRNAAPDDAPASESTPKLCLWIDRRARTVSKTRTEATVAVLCTSEAQRERFIKSLMQKHFRIIP